MLNVFLVQALGSHADVITWVQCLAKEENYLLAGERSEILSIDELKDDKNISLAQT